MKVRVMGVGGVDGTSTAKSVFISPGPGVGPSAKPDWGTRRKQLVFKMPLSNGVYSAKNARRYLVIKIQQTKIDGVLVRWLASRLSVPETVRKQGYSDICVVDLWPP
jgi:hypothetical protein